MNGELILSEFRYGASMTARYHEDVAPGAGMCPPRAAVATDAAALPLDGDWRFRLVPSADAVTAGFQDPGFDDTGWERLPVPAHWQLHGYGTPA